jgi:hypothetical protein
MRPNMTVAAICLVSIAALAACQPSQSLDAAATNSEPLKVQPTPAAKPALKISAKKTVADAPAIEARTVAAKQNTAASATAKQNASELVMTTVTGCLELRDDGMFQLKDTDGSHAPKSRSWKSGFIKKGAANVDVFDAGNRLKLGTHVGYRVSISGALTDRELRARSLRATSETCE